MNITDNIGNTPLVNITNVNNNAIYGKLEYFNPTGSVKDRAALFMIKGAEERGDLSKGGSIVEATSGNTGIGLALAGCAKGYKVTIVMPENMSVERIAIMKALGAEVILTDKAKGMNGAVDKAREISKATGAFMPMQFSNVDNIKAHYKGTAPEIFGALSADYVVCGVGSAGTAIGIKRYIIDNRLAAEVVAVQPTESPMLTGGLPAPHGIQGIGANFVPELYDKAIIDSVESITSADALIGARELSKLGILAGISSGAAYKAALNIANSVNGKNIVFIAPDSATRYISMGIYE